MQQRLRKRNIDGILLLDKPTGITSNAALQMVKRLYGAQKAGHTGSLDPLASGMLPICFGEATKFSQYLLDADKHYLVIAKLGIKTNTGDAEGEVVERRTPRPITREQLAKILAEFRGDITQVPSMFSAIKHQGQPLYKLARQGITIERQARHVQIHSLELLEQQTDTLTFEVKCSKGTYIRTLTEDIGEAMGCGAHVSFLRRLSAGDYEEEQMISLDTLTQLFADHGFAAIDRLLLPLGTSVQGWPDVRLSPAAAYYLRRGQPVIVPHAPVDGWVRLTMNEGQFLGVGEILSDGKVAPRRLVQQAKQAG